MYLLATKRKQVSITRTGARRAGLQGLGARPSRTEECEHAAPPEGCHYVSAATADNPCAVTLVCNPAPVALPPAVVPVSVPDPTPGPNVNPYGYTQIPPPQVVQGQQVDWVAYLSQFYDLTPAQKQAIATGGMNQPIGNIGPLAPKGSTPNSNYSATPAAAASAATAPASDGIPTWGWVVMGLVGWAWWTSK